MAPTNTTLGNLEEARGRALLPPPFDLDQEFVLSPGRWRQRMRGPYLSLSLHLGGGFVSSPGAVGPGGHNDAQLPVLLDQP